MKRLELLRNSMKHEGVDLMHTWTDDEGPTAALGECLSAAGATAATSVVLDETMRADFAALIQDALPNADRQFTANTIGALRMRKDTLR